MTLRIAFNVVAAGLMGLACASAGSIMGLGTAGNYLVLDAGSGSQFSVSGGSTKLNGTMGLAQGSTYNLSGSGSPGVLQYYGTDTGSSSSSISLVQGSSGNGINSALTAAVLAAQTAYTSDFALTPNQTVSGVVSQTANNSFSASGASTVIDLVAGIDFNGGGATNITINGTANDLFVFQVNSQFVTTSGLGITLTGGVTASDILWLYSGTTALSMTGGSGTWDGSVITENAGITIHDSTFDGSFISLAPSTDSSSGISITSNPTLNMDAFTVGTPEPSTFLLGAPLLLIGLAFRRLKTRAAARAE